MQVNRKIFLFCMLSVSDGLRISMFMPTIYYYFLDLFDNDAREADKYRGFVSTAYALGGILGM